MALRDRVLEQMINNASIEEILERVTMVRFLRLWKLRSLVTQ
jgi:hypothetical protein